MKIKRVKYCGDCEDKISEEIVYMDKIKFYENMSRNSSNYYLEDGEDYQGVWIDDDRLCIDCNN